MTSILYTSWVTLSNISPWPDCSSLEGRQPSLIWCQLCVPWWRNYHSILQKHFLVPSSLIVLLSFPSVIFSLHFPMYRIIHQKTAIFMSVMASCVAQLIPMKQGTYKGSTFKTKMNATFFLLVFLSSAGLLAHRLALESIGVWSKLPGVLSSGTLGTEKSCTGLLFHIYHLQMGKQGALNTDWELYIEKFYMLRQGDYHFIYLNA